MFEIKITINVPELTEAIKSLVAAMNKGNGLLAQSFSTLQPHAQIQNSAPLPTAQVVSKIHEPVQTAPQIPAAPTAPIAGVPLADAPQFTVDQIMAAGATLMDNGKVDDLLNLLHSFGVQAVMELKPNQLGAFATEMRKLGATI